MKRALLALALLAVLPVAAAQADPISVGDQIRITAGTPRQGAGGEFVVTGPGYAFDTFCVEKSEFISLPGTYWVGDISREARYNGDYTNPFAPVPLTPQVAFLYTVFRANTWANFGLSYSTNADAENLQNAIWSLLGEQGAPSGNAYYDKANAVVGTGTWTGFGDVYILNLYSDAARTQRAQDQLATVPEPGSMLLLATGLFGLGSAVRRRARK